MELVGGPGLRAGVLLAGQQRGQADPGRGQAIALQDALDGPRAGERTDAQGLQLGTDGRGPDQTVAGGRRGMGLEPAADGEDGPLQFGWDPLSVLVAGPCPVVEALGAGLQVAAPPLVEPECGAADGGADGLDGSAGQAQGNGAMTSGEFVVHGYLRVATACSCPRGKFDIRAEVGEASQRPWRPMRRVSVSSDALSVRGDSKLAMCCRKKVSDALSVRR